MGFWFWILDLVLIWTIVHPKLNIEAESFLFILYFFLNPQQMAKYFTAYRIDHILGFFRIWELPDHAATGLVGKFRPSIPLSQVYSCSFKFKGHLMQWNASWNALTSKIYFFCTFSQFIFHVLSVVGRTWTRRNMGL